MSTVVAAAAAVVVVVTEGWAADGAAQCRLGTVQDREGQVRAGQPALGVADLPLSLPLLVHLWGAAAGMRWLATQSIWMKGGRSGRRLPLRRWQRTGEQWVSSGSKSI